MGGALNDARLLVDALRDPASTAALDGAGWNALLAMARAERLIGTLAHRIDMRGARAPVTRLLADACADADQGRTAALWEAEMARRALAPLGVPVLLLKGTAFVAAGLAAGQGRSIGDLDILVPRDALDAVEAALLAAGWEWVKPDPYDDAYYRRWMHELPPLIHKLRDRMIDVHHTILPRTHRITPDALALVSDAVPSADGFAVLNPADMACHCAAHMLADGDLQGGLRNLWDFNLMTGDFAAADQGFWDWLDARARLHGLQESVRRAARLSRDLYGAVLPAGWDAHDPADRWFRQRLLARDDWGRVTQPLLEQAFYIRSHWLRMPAAMLARHLWTKWRKR